MTWYLRTFCKTGVVLFCLWHMFAVAAYSIPNKATDPVSTWFYAHISAPISPYILLASQWQQWNLFSPDPLRRIMVYHLETKQEDGSWAQVGSINDETYGPFRHAVRFKLLGQVFPESNDVEPVTERAAHILCTEFGLDASAHIRIWRDVAIIPHLFPSPSMAWWNTWTPQYEPTLVIDTFCTPQ